MIETKSEKHHEIRHTPNHHEQTAVNRIAADADILLDSPDALAASLGGALIRIASNADIAPSLPKLVKAGNLKENGWQNADMLAVTTEDESVRLALFDNGTYAIGYHPKGDGEKAAVNDAFDTLAMRQEGVLLNKYFMGVQVRVDEQSKSASIVGFGRKDVAGRFAPYFFDTNTVSGEPVLTTMERTLRNGMAKLPKQMRAPQNVTPKT